MNSLIPVHIIRFILLVLIQVFLLDNIGGIFGDTRIMIYPMFIMLLPFQTPHWLLILLGFIMGLAVDLFTNTPGINSFALTTVAFLRPYICQAIVPRGGYDINQSPNKHTFGIEWFVKYSAILLLICIFIYFLMSYLTFSKILPTLLFTTTSFILSYIILILTQYIFNPKI